MTETGWFVVEVMIALGVLSSIELWVAVAVIRKREPISVIRDMNVTIAEMSTRLRASEKRQEESHKQIIRLESIVAELDNGLKILLRQLDKLRVEPDYTRLEPLMAEAISAAATEAFAAGEKGTLQRKMARRFNLSELDDIALELGIEDGELSGDTTSQRAREIIQYQSHRDKPGERDQLDRLIAVCKRERPMEEW